MTRKVSRHRNDVDYSHGAQEGTGTPAWLKAEKRQLAFSDELDQEDERPAKKNKSSRKSAPAVTTGGAAAQGDAGGRSRPTSAGATRSSSSKRSTAQPAKDGKAAAAAAAAANSRLRATSKKACGSQGAPDKTTAPVSATVRAAAAAGPEEGNVEQQVQQEKQQRRSHAAAGAAPRSQASRSAIGASSAQAASAAAGGVRCLPSKPESAAAVEDAATAAQPAAVTSRGGSAAGARGKSAAARKGKAARLEAAAAGAGVAASSVAPMQPEELLCANTTTAAEAAATTAAADTTGKSEFAKLQAEYRQLHAMYDELKAQKIAEMEGLLAVQDSHVINMGKESQQLVEHWRKEAEQQRLFAASVRSAETVRHIKQLQDSKLLADAMLLEKEQALLELQAQVADLQEKLLLLERRPHMVGQAVQATPGAADAGTSCMAAAGTAGGGRGAPAAPGTTSHSAGAGPLRETQQSTPNHGGSAAARAAGSSPVTGLLTMPGAVTGICASSTKAGHGAPCGTPEGANTGGSVGRHAALWQQQQQQPGGSSAKRGAVPEFRPLLQPLLQAQGFQCFQGTPVSCGATTPVVHFTPVSSSRRLPSSAVGSLARCHARAQQLDQLRQALRQGLPSLLVAAGAAEAPAAEVAAAAVPASPGLAAAMSSSPGLRAVAASPAAGISSLSPLVAAARTPTAQPNGASSAATPAATTSPLAGACGAGDAMPPVQPKSTGRAAPPASVARRSPGSASRSLPLLPLSYLCDFDPQLTEEGRIQYRHMATGFTFLLGPAGAAQPSPFSADRALAAGGQDVAFVPVHCGSAEAALPDFLKEPFTFSPGEKPQLMKLLFSALAEAASAGRTSW